MGLLKTSLRKKHIILLMNYQTNYHLFLFYEGNMYFMPSVIGYLALPPREFAPEVVTCPLTVKLDDELPPV